MSKTENVIPAIQPVKLEAVGSLNNGAKQIVRNFFRKLRVQNYQWPFPAQQLSGPGAMQHAVVFIDADFDLLPCVVQSYFLPLLRQSARNCAWPLSVSG